MQGVNPYRQLLELAPVATLAVTLVAVSPALGVARGPVPEAEAPTRQTAPPAEVTTQEASPPAEIATQEASPSPESATRESPPQAENAAQESPPEAAAEAEADPRIELYVAKCASCHTVGKGARVGPDLSGVHNRRDRAWLVQMISNPSRLLASDADARSLLLEYGGVKMPELGLTTDEVEGLIDLVVECSDVPCELAGKFTPVAEATDFEIARGRELFLGNEPLINGGIPCLACHTVRGVESAVPGGTLGADLTHAFARLGDEGLDVALKNPVFLVMNKVFGDHPLDPEEAFALRAFLNETNTNPEPDRSSLSLPLFGLLIAGAVMVILNAVWSRRLRGVRQPLTRRSAALAGAKRRSPAR